MSWYKRNTSLAYRIHAVYLETIRIFLQPQISDLFDDGRKKARHELLKELHVLLKDVHELEVCKREDEPLDHKDFS